MHELQFKPQANAGDPDVALVSTDQLAAAAEEGKTTIPVGQRGFLTSVAHISHMDVPLAGAHAVS